VLGALLVLGGLGYLAIPSVHDQLDLSLSRQETPFVELYAVSLDDASHVGTTCQPGETPGTTEVVFAMRSHLGQAEQLGYEVSAHEPADQEQGAARSAQDSTGAAIGTPVTADVPVLPGDTATERVDVPVPARRAFDVQVRLPSTGQYLLLHCAGFAAAGAAQ
jgi:hypothetical protein